MGTRKVACGVLEDLSIAFITREMGPFEWDLINFQTI